MGLKNSVDAAARASCAGAGACHQASQVENINSSSAAYAHGHASRELRCDLTGEATDPFTFMVPWFPTNEHIGAAQHLLASDAVWEIHHAME